MYKTGAMMEHTRAVYNAGSERLETALFEKGNDLKAGLRLLVSPLKTAFLFVYLYLGYVQLRDMLLSLIGKSRVVVLYYHRIGDSIDPMTRTADEFRSDLRYLSSKYECISLQEMCRRLREGARFKRRAAVITFDDGYRDNYLEAAPILKEAGLTATFFVSTGFISTSNQFPHDVRRDSGRVVRPKLTWDDLREMQRSGFEIGSHTVNHSDLGRAGARMMEYEISESLRALTKELGEASRPFSFPWGKPENMSESAVQAVERAGYYSASSAYGGANTSGTGCFRIQRVDTGNGALTGLAFKAKIAGFDPDYYRLRLLTLMGRNRIPGRDTKSSAALDTGRTN